MLVNKTMPTNIALEKLHIGSGHTSLNAAIKLFNKKFRNFCEKNPLRLSYVILPSELKVVISRANDQEVEKTWAWTLLLDYVEEGIESFVLQQDRSSAVSLASAAGRTILDDIINQAVKQFIYEVRLDLAAYLPILTYRKYDRRDLSPDEMATKLVKSNWQKEKDNDTFVTELVKEKQFVMEQIFLAKGAQNPKSLFALSDENGIRYLYKFKTDLVMPFLYKMWHFELPPEELGKEFFSQAKLISKKGEENGN